MKKPKLDWKEIYIVKGWQTKVIKGIGVFFPKLKENICTYDDYWLVFINDNPIPEKVYKTEVFEDHQKAINQIIIEKQQYLKFCSEQVLEYSKKVNELSR